MNRSADRLSLARTALLDLYGLSECAIGPLAGELDDNFLVVAPDGERSVLKVMHGDCSETRVALQCAVLDHLSRSARDFRHPTVSPTRVGDPLGRIEWEGEERVVWRIGYCSGTLVAQVRPRDEPLLRSWGRLLGRLTAALADFSPRESIEGHRWQLSRAGDAAELTGSVTRELRDEVDRTLARFTAEIAPRLSELPVSVVHNDANDHNLVTAERDGGFVVDGIFDFGDLCREPTICELAIGTAYAMLEQDDPLWAAANVVRGYREVATLRDDELEILFDLAKTRLAVSLAVSSRRHRDTPNDPYVTISQRPVREALERLRGVSSRWAAAHLRYAGGLEPVEGADRVARFLDDPTTEIHAVIDLPEEPLVLDLSSGSLLLGADPAATEVAEMTRRIESEMVAASVDRAIGRWAESRAIYTSPLFSGAEHPTVPSRTHHLGIDLFAAPDTPVYAPLDGVVEIARDNGQGLDYGGLVVLRHEIPGDDQATQQSFFTLYGHLGLESVARLKPGDRIAAGSELSRLGGERENGGWPPHLHLQVIADLLDLGSDFPGVALERDAELWQRLSPNPAALFGRSPESVPGFDARSDPGELRRRRETRLGYNLSLSYTEPLHIVRGFLQYLYDSRAYAYLDVYNNVPHVGHSHPRVVEAVQRQIGLLNTNTRYLHETILTYADRLVEKLPAELEVCFFVNSGSEANELALRLAHSWTGRRDVLVAEGAYHGHTSALIDVSPYKHDGPGGRGAPDHVHVVPNPDTFRGEFRRDDPEAAERYSAQVADRLSKAERAGRPIGALLLETYPSVGGQIVPPPGYLAAAYAHARAAGAIAIADEIQTGFGRLGKAFWGFEAQGAVPDIVVLGKPIANGFPMGAVVTRREIAESFDNGMEFFSTFGGNPVACAAALAVLDIVEEEGLPAKAARLGSRFLESLAELRREHTLIGDVRGEGFFLGIELVRDPETLDPADDETRYVADRLRDHRILAGVDGVDHNVLKIRPSMAIEEGDLDLVVDRLDSIFRETRIAR